MTDNEVKGMIFPVERSWKTYTKYPHLGRDVKMKIPTLLSYIQVLIYFRSPIS
jgi:hypothetical protein